MLSLGKTAFTLKTMCIRMGCFRTFGRFTFNPTICKTSVRSKPPEFQTVYQCNRWYSEMNRSKLKKMQQKQLPFEIDTKVSENILLYSLEGKQIQCALISGVGVFVFFALLNSAHTVYTTMRDIEPVEDHGVKYPWWHWWRHINLGTSFIRTSLAGLLALFGGCALAMAMIYPSTMVKSITLLKGGERIIFSSYAPFGRVKTRELPLRDVSALWGSEQVVNLLPIKVRGKWLQYLISTNGIYHNRPLFNQTIALNRKFV